MAERVCLHSQITPAYVDLASQEATAKLVSCDAVCGEKGLRVLWATYKSVAVNLATYLDKDKCY